MINSRLVGTNFHYFCFPLEYYLDTQVRLGLRTVELFAGSPHFRMDAYGHEDCGPVRELLENKGLRCPVFTPEIASFHYPLCIPDQEWRQKSVNYWLQAIDAAGKLGCSVVCAALAGGFKDLSYEQQWDWCRESLKVLTERAGRAGLCLALEAAEKKYGIMAGDLNAVRRMTDEVEGLYAALDTAAMAEAGETIEEWTESLGGKLAHVHFSDSTTGKYERWGEGNLDASHILRALNQAGYKGIYSLRLDEYDYYDEPDKEDAKNLQGLCCMLDKKGGWDYL